VLYSKTLSAICYLFIIARKFCVYIKHKIRLSVSQNTSPTAMAASDLTKYYVPVRSMWPVRCFVTPCVCNKVNRLNRVTNDTSKKQIIIIFKKQKLHLYAHLFSFVWTSSCNVFSLSHTPMYVLITDLFIKSNYWKLTKDTNRTFTLSILTSPVSLSATLCAIRFR